MEKKSVEENLPKADHPKGEKYKNGTSEDTLFCHNNRTKRVWVALSAAGLVLVVLLGVVVGGSAILANNYQDRVIPGLTIGNTVIGGMDRNSLKEFLIHTNNTYIDSGIDITYTVDNNEQQSTIFPIIVSESNSVEMISFLIDDELERLLSYGKGESFLFTGKGILMGMRKPQQTHFEFLEIDHRRLEEQFTELLSDFEKPAIDANISITSLNPFEYNVSSSATGIVYDYNAILLDLENQWRNNHLPQLIIAPVHQDPSVTKDDIDVIAERLPEALTGLEYNLVYDHPIEDRLLGWRISPAMITDWIEPVKTDDSNEITFSLSESALSVYLQEEVRPDVAFEPVNARFAVGENKEVEEFRGSRAGYDLDIDETIALINTAFVERFSDNPDAATTTIELVVHDVEPDVKTADINELGITEVLGVGSSSFAGSPSNRVKNILNAIDKLNGILVAPGEEFSTINHTKPYTISGGYLPELVIKGDEIIPEIGGGLCQIGTTLFRMAMNSGMEITQRRNHSLVVPYYNDLSNGLPGTDATLYDPAPDFKFKNDTENYILVETDIDLNKQMLYFTIWGTNDGRDAYYSSPVVHNWIGHGATKYVETTKLAPGVTKCQHGYTGARTSFTYTRELSDGTLEEEVFESYYRALPQICLIGVAVEGSETPVGATCDPATDPACQV